MQTLLVPMVQNAEEAPHPSELENGIAIRINERFPKLKSTQEKYPLCQIFSKVIPSSDNMDTLDACLTNLSFFFLKNKQN